MTTPTPVINAALQMSQPRPSCMLRQIEMKAKQASKNSIHVVGTVAARTPKLVQVAANVPSKMEKLDGADEAIKATKRNAYQAPQSGPPIQLS